MNNKTPPYNTGKVLIGSRYSPPLRPVSQTQDDMALQRALLSRDSSVRVRLTNLINALKGE